MAQAVFFLNTDAANDPCFDPDPKTPAPAQVAVDPGVEAWAEDFDRWLASADGQRWLEQEADRFTTPWAALEDTGKFLR